MQVAAPARSASGARATTASATPPQGTSSTTTKPVAVTLESDPELRALERAEKVLFPQSLRGIRAGFSFEDDGDWARPFPEALPANAQTSSTQVWYRNLVLPSMYPNVDGRILTYLEFYRSKPEGRAILRAWAKKRGKYESVLVQALTKSGLPRDLVWQSLVESAHNPTIRSPAGAAGIWQFMPETARLYGLTVDRWIDERLDPERATEAAAKMMGAQFQRFGNWELALSAYNMGEAGLARTIRKYNTNDFWTLSRYESGLPWETALYVPRIIAITIAMNNPKEFGIDDVVPDDPIALDTVVLSAGMSLLTIARAAGISEQQLASYNPQLLAGRLPPVVGAAKALVRVYVPAGLGEGIRNRLSRLAGPEPDLEGYAVKRGETIDSIASRLALLPATIREINRLGDSESVEPGTVLLLPRSSATEIDGLAGSSERIAVVPPDTRLPVDKKRAFYRVSAGDTLSKVADGFGLSRAELLEANSLDPSAKLQPDMLLQVFLPKDFVPKDLKYEDSANYRVLLAGSEPFLEYFESQRGNERVVVQAKANDTLATIGARHGVSIGTMERINRRSRREVLLPGEPIVVYVQRTPSAVKVGTAP